MSPTNDLLSGQFPVKSECKTLNWLNTLNPLDGLSLQRNELYSLRMEGIFCDIIVQVEDSTDIWVDFAAHKVILVAASPYFRSLYDSNGLLNVMRMPSTIGVMAFSLLLDVLYGKTITLAEIKAITLDSVSLVEDLVTLASLLQLDGILTQLRGWQKEVVDKRSVVQVKREINIHPDESKTPESPEGTFCKIELDEEVLSRKARDPRLRKSSPWVTSIGREDGDGEDDPNNFDDDTDDTNDDNYVPSPPPKKWRTTQIQDALKPSGARKQSASSKNIRSSLKKRKSHALKPKDKKRLFKGSNRQRKEDDGSNEDVGKEASTSQCWFRASEREVSFFGMSLPRTKHVKMKSADDVVTIEGELRAEKGLRNLELKLANGEKQTDINVTKRGEFYDCPFCPSGGDGLKSLKYKPLLHHFLSRHHYILIDEAVVCELCNYVSHNLGSVESHLVCYHNLDDGDPKETLNLCQLCGEVCSSKRQLARHHMKMHGKKKCGTCSISFPSVISYDNHMTNEHGVPYQFQCKAEGCSFSTNTKSTFSDHLFSIHKINDDDKPIFHCAFCDYTTIRKITLEKHELTHTAKEFDFKCEHEGCGSAFRQWRHLKQHYTNCHGQLNLPCEHCSETFPSRKRLQQHQKSAHSVRVPQFRCGYCTYVSAWKHGVTTHTQRIHKGQVAIVIDLRKADAIV